MFVRRLVLSVGVCLLPTLAMAQPGAVVISEIAWMGTETSPSDEWIELANTTDAPIDLTGWTLRAVDGTPNITLSGTIAPNGFFLLERTNDDTIPDIPADQIYTGAMGDGGERLELRSATELIDTANGDGPWFAGSTALRRTMARIELSASGTSLTNWRSSSLPYGAPTLGRGTPRALNLWGGTSSDWFQVYFAQNRTAVMPSYGPRAMALALTSAIDAATTSIEFAVYGFNGNEALLEALYAAQARGVAIKGVVDSTASGNYSYRDTETVIQRFGAANVAQDNLASLMHNKFFVIDSRFVWTGSTNLSRNELDTEYFGDVSILIDNALLAAAYQTEVLEMFRAWPFFPYGCFSSCKVDNTTHVFGPLPDGTLIESYFSPSDHAEALAIVRAIQQARTRIDMRAFILTSAPIRDALIAARAQGVVIRVILDAHHAGSPFSVHAALRAAGIFVKTETWGGAEHTKALVVDDYITVLGSHNFTASADQDNDENTLYIENRPLAAAYQVEFDSAWNSIDNYWLTHDADAESPDSPGSLSDLIDNDFDDATDEGAPEVAPTIETGPGAVNIYFLRQALHQGAVPATNRANYNVNLESRLIARINAATTTIDMAAYELNLPGIVDALIAARSRGVQVRFILDGKDEPGSFTPFNYNWMRLHYERLARAGVVVFADSIIFAETTVARRQEFRTFFGIPEPDLPDSLVGGPFPLVTVCVGTNNRCASSGGTNRTGYRVADAERRDPLEPPWYFAGDDQMHNKFGVFDGTWVWTGSWNFTINDTFGSWPNRQAGILAGNTNHGIEVYLTELADAYRLEFEEMWGSTQPTPNSFDSNFHARKTDNTPHEFVISDTRRLKLYFSPGDNAMGQATTHIRDFADHTFHFSIFTFSWQPLTSALKRKWETFEEDLVGERTDFQMQGVFEGTQYTQDWSASQRMIGVQQPRWVFRPPIFRDREDRFIHHKYGIVDVNTASDPFVITGSTNWTANGNNTNDENMLLIFDAAFANQFYQEFGARYFMAGGRVSFLVP